MPDPTQNDFRDIFDSYRSSARRLAERWGVQGADVDDVCQRAFLVLWRKQHLVPRGSERAFLAAVLRREAARLRRLRGSRREAEAQAAGMTVGANRVSEQIETRSQLRGLLEALQSEAPECASLVQVMASDGAERELAAELLGLPLGTVKSRLARLRRRFSQFGN